MRTFDFNLREYNDVASVTLADPILKLVNQFFERDYIWWGRWCDIPLIVDTLTLYFPTRDCSGLVSELVVGGQLWKKIRKVKFTGMRQNKEWVVLPSWGGGGKS